MDNRGNPHPLDIFVEDKNIYILEAMVPLVPLSYRKPLIMYIKYKELMDILKNVEKVSQTLGNVNGVSSPDEILNYMSGYMPGNIMSNINMLKTVMAISEMQSGSPTPDNETSGDSLYDNILSIINQGDNSSE